MTAPYLLIDQSATILQRAFAENAKGTLDYLQVGTFNEHIAQPQKNPYPTFAKSMGLEGDAYATKLWVPNLSVC